jgi:hypothetical protein
MGIKAAGPTHGKERKAHPASSDLHPGNISSKIGRGAVYGWLKFFLGFSQTFRRIPSGCPDTCHKIFNTTDFVSFRRYITSAVDTASLYNLRTNRNDDFLIL